MTRDYKTASVLISNIISALKYLSGWYIFPCPKPLGVIPIFPKKKIFPRPRLYFVIPAAFLFFLAVSNAWASEVKIFSDKKDPALPPALGAREFEDKQAKAENNIARWNMQAEEIDRGFRFNRNTMNLREKLPKIAASRQTAVSLVPVPVSPEEIKRAQKYLGPEVVAGERIPPATDLTGAYLPKTYHIFLFYNGQKQIKGQCSIPAAFLGTSPEKWYKVDKGELVSIS
jgi:hypothetical protein